MMYVGTPARRALLNSVLCRTHTWDLEKKDDFIIPGIRHRSATDMKKRERNKS